MTSGESARVPHGIGTVEQVRLGDPQGPRVVVPSSTGHWREFGNVTECFCPKISQAYGVAGVEGNLEPYGQGSFSARVRRVERELLFPAGYGS
jgi:hypothetical protein